LRQINGFPPGLTAVFLGAAILLPTAYFPMPRLGLNQSGSGGNAYKLPFASQRMIKAAADMWQPFVLMLVFFRQTEVI